MTKKTTKTTKKVAVKEVKAVKVQKRDSKGRYANGFTTKRSTAKRSA